MQIDFRPIKVWPDGWSEGDFGGVGSPFSATYENTLTLLDRELEQLSARTVIVQLAITAADVRADGGLRAGAKVRYRGVILSFDAQVGRDVQVGHESRRTLVYACNAYLGGWRFEGPQGWQANLRAIALGLEALRKLERYGIANRGQQYAGWAELGTGIEVGPAMMTLTQAACFVADESYEPGAPIFDRCDGGDLLLDEETVTTQAADAAYRRAAKRLHPDAGGTPEAFRRLAEARDVLSKAHQGRMT